MSVIEAEQAVQATQRKLDDATDAQRLAEKAYLESGTDKDLDVQVRTTAKTARARTLHEKATEALNVARAVQRAAEVEATREQHRLDLLSLPHFAEVLDALNERVITVDRSLDSLALDYARAVSSAQRDYDAAAERAASIGATLGSIVRPTVGDAVLAARTVATQVRHSEGREDVSDLLTDEANGWKVADLNAEDRAAHARTAERNRASEVVHNAARMTLATLNAAKE